MSIRKLFALAATLGIIPLSGCLAESETEYEAMDPASSELGEAEDAVCSIPYDPAYIGFFSNGPAVQSLSSSYPYLPNDNCSVKVMHRVRGYGFYSSTYDTISYSAWADLKPTNQAACLDSFVEVDAYHYKNLTWTWKGTRKRYGSWSNNACYLSAGFSEPLDANGGYQAFQVNGRYYNAQIGQFAPVWAELRQKYPIIK